MTGQSREVLHSQKALRGQEALRGIGEVAEDLDLPPHVLRFWETRFKQIEPVKRAGGRRFYRQRDVELVAAIRRLLYGEGYTIKGVQRILEEQGVRAVVDSLRAGAPGLEPQPPIPPAPRIEPAPPDIAHHTGNEPPYRVSEPPVPTAVQPEPRIEPEPPEIALHTVSEPPCPAPEPLPQPASPQPASAPPLAPVSRALNAEAERRLRAALAELDECKRLLTPARS